MSEDIFSTKPDVDRLLQADFLMEEAMMRLMNHDQDEVLLTHIDDSSWSVPLKLSFATGGVVSKSYFVKITKTALGMSMARGEYESMALLHSVVPENAIEPISWGTCSSLPDHHFYISAFHDLVCEIPDVKTLCEMTSKLHSKSADLFEQGNLCPEESGSFGFHVTTHMGAIPQDNMWAKSWEEFFTRNMHCIISHEIATQGVSEELDSLTKSLIKGIIPRLLRPLETCGRRVRPALIHGDLQTRNIKSDRNTSRPMIFDAGSFWGHNECELGKWRPERFSIGKEYMEEYHKRIPKSEPIDDWEDRNILYSIRFNLLSSAHYPEDPTFRAMAMDDIQYLAQKLL